MAKPRVMMLCNEPLLAADHPAAESEHSVLAIAENLTGILNAEGFVVTPLRLGADPTVLWSELNKRPPDVVFNLYEGQVDQAETESYVAGLLEWAGVPYTGSPFSTLTVARAKHWTKYLFQGAGLPTADFVVVNHLPLPDCRLTFPVIVKPALLDASVGVDQASVCENSAQLKERLRHVLKNYGAPVLVEEYIEGRELHVALVELPDLQALPPSEIVFRKDSARRWSILTYASKWKPGTTEYDATPPKFPAAVPAAKVRELGLLAQKAYRLLGCRDYARVDFRLNSAGKPFILEVNPNPEISEDASFVGCLGAANLTHREFIVRLVQQALSRNNAPRPSFDMTLQS